MSHQEYRNGILKKVDDYLAVVLENIERQPPSEYNSALALFISNLGRFVELMQKAKNDEAFVIASKTIDEVLEEHFFSKVYGRKSNDVKKELNQQNMSNLSSDHHEVVQQMVKENSSASAESEEFDLYVHAPKGISKIPKEVRMEIAEALKSLGLNEEEINKKLELN
jgi:small nuclear ribonucleoprotein (snRNP)-like protein